MWPVVLRVGSQVLLWAGTASTGWFLSDWFNETNTTKQTENYAQASGNPPVKEEWWNKKRVIALGLGVVALVLWIRRGGLDKFKK